MLVSLQEADDHLGRIAVGTVESGTLKVGDPIAAINRDGEITERGTVCFIRLLLLLLLLLLLSFYCIYFLFFIFFIFIFLS